MKSIRSNGALRISLTYILFAGLWITTSDLFIGWVVVDSQTMAKISLLKGWLFVVVTGVVLYFTLAREFKYREKIEEDIRKLNSELEERVQQRTEQLTAAYKEMESCCYSVSHDLRAPLRAIDGFSQILLEEHQGRLDEEGQNQLRRIRAASQHMAEIIDAILQLSRLSRVDLKKRVINLSQMAHDAVAELLASDPERKVEWSIQPELTAFGDEVQMRIVLANLFQNAWKFTARMENARVEFLSEQQQGEMVFHLRDNGMGFDMLYAEKLFMPFQRLHSAQEFEGTGIGLALVKQIISRHGGRLWAWGEVGKGAVFSFTLPGGEQNP